jgi:hypothetical protein
MYKEYQVNIHRIFGKGMFHIESRSEKFMLNSHKPNYKLGLSGDKYVQVNPIHEEVAFFIKYKPRSAPDTYDMNIGVYYHYVLFEGSFPITVNFPFNSLGDNTFNFNIEKLHFDTDKTIDVKLDFEYSDGTNSTCWNSNFDFSTQSGRLSFRNTENAKMNKTLSSSVKISNKDRSPKFEVMVANVMLLPENIKSVLPKNSYISGQIVHRSDDKESDYDFLNKHLYVLTRDHNKENFILVELSSCLGSVDFAIGEVIDGVFKNSTRHTYKTYESYGKTMIEIFLEDKIKDAFIMIYGKTFADEDDLKIASYILRYNSYKDSRRYKVYKLSGNGLVNYNLTNGEFKFDWGSVTSDEGNEIQAKYIARILKVDNQYESNSNSICYIHGLNSYVKVKSKYKNSDSLILKESDMEPNQKYYVNILAITDDNNDNTMLAYPPVQIISNRSYPTFMIGIYFINFSCVCCIVDWVVCCCLYIVEEV